MIHEAPARALAIAASLIAVASCGRDQPEPEQPAEPVAMVAGEPVRPLNEPDKEISPERALWRDYLVVHMRIVHPLRQQLIEDEVIRVTPDDLAAAGIDAQPEASDRNRAIMLDAMLSGAISGLEIRLEQGRPGDDPAELKKRLATLRAVADDPDATEQQKIDALGPRAQQQFGQAASRVPRDFARARLLAWKADRLLFERHGGRVVERADPGHPDASYTIPIDAYHAWLTDLEERDAWDLYANFEDRFNELFDVLPIDTPLEDPDAYYAAPPDLSRSLADKSADEPDTRDAP